MASYAWTEQDLKQMAAAGITPQTVQQQLDLFKNPPPFIQLDRPAIFNDGISQLADLQITSALNQYEEAKNQGRFLKFVPSSGAATRMFQVLFKFSNQPLTKEKLEQSAEGGDKDSAQFLNFMTHLKKAAFYSELDKKMNAAGTDLEKALESADYATVLRYLLTVEGLDYAQKPKGLIHFHSYENEKRTSFEEHLIEGEAYCCSEQKPSRIHFTVSQEHMESFKEHYLQMKAKGFSSEVEFSVQDPSTQTIAVDESNQPFRNEEGHLVFRPAGHGALINNLDSLHGDVVYIKNIDNVTIETSLETTTRWKKILGGHLVELQNKIFLFLKMLEVGKLAPEELPKVVEFGRKELCFDMGGNFDALSVMEKIEWLKRRLDRPIRVCGVVKNTGEPGGGPFWVKDVKGNRSLQIVESSQINMKDAQQKQVFDRSTHFNPVDLVCGVRDHNGKPFELKNYVDHSAVFISSKSVNGKAIKALELPGLWNGAMANWITLFVEVPAETFNPVKTVFDLLKPAHQS